jgi:hypothetical protein
MKASLKKRSPVCWLATRGGTGKSLDLNVDIPTAARKRVLEAVHEP